MEMAFNLKVLIQKMGKPTPSIPSLYKNLHFSPILITLVLNFFLTMSITAQNNEQLVGHWKLQKVSFKNTVLQTSETNKEQLLDIFKAALYKDLTEEQRLTLEDLELMNVEAELLRDKYHQTTIEFQANDAFYNTSQLPDKSLSGEYLLDKKKLLLEWETGDKNELKVVKITGDALVLKDGGLGVTYYYSKNLNNINYECNNFKNNITNCIFPI